MIDFSTMSIGETFDYLGDKCIVAETTDLGFDCLSCVFHGEYECEVECGIEEYPCSPKNRADGKQVFFKYIEDEDED